MVLFLWVLQDIHYNTMDQVFFHHVGPTLIMQLWWSAIGAVWDGGSRIVGEGNGERMGMRGSQRVIPAASVIWPSRLRRDFNLECV